MKTTIWPRMLKALLKLINQSTFKFTCYVVIVWETARPILCATVMNSWCTSVYWWVSIYQLYQLYLMRLSGWCSWWFPCHLNVFGGTLNLAQSISALFEYVPCKYVLVLYSLNTGLCLKSSLIIKILVLLFHFSAMTAFSEQKYSILRQRCNFSFVHFAS